MDETSTPRHYRFGQHTVCGLSDTGRVRRATEDSFLVDEALGLITVADGMGGHAGGALASATAVDCVAHALRAARAGAAGWPDALLGNDDPDATASDALLGAVRMVLDAVRTANAEVYARNHASGVPSGRGMGTTLTGLWQPAPQGPMIIFQVGDSRLYRCRAGTLDVLTRDQTLYQQALDQGAIDHLPPRNLLLQALGPTHSVTPVLQTQVAQRGDRYLLCSDGLYGALPHHEIEAVLAGADSATLDTACRALVSQANQAGGHDNITVVLTCYGMDAASACIAAADDTRHPA